MPAASQIPTTPFGPGGELPAPEMRGHRLAIRLVAITSLLASGAYLVWRAGFTFGNLWISIPLWLLELHAAIGLALFTFSLWDLDSAAVPPPVEDTDLRVAVLIPTCNEPREALLPTIAAAVALSPDHETWVLDDGGRAWVKDLAGELGAQYLAREEHSHAKAGNINYALAHIDADLVAVLDADHVATPPFLTHTLGYFADPKIAAVQTPQDFYNIESFEHDRNRSWFWPGRRSMAYNEQRLFYRALQPGKNRWDAAFWCGTNAIVRVAALQDVGGVAYDTVTEDIHTTVRMQRKGWRTVYHNEVLAYGLAARDAEQYQSQRLRWGTGAMQLLHLEHPLTGPGLDLRQRLAYAATLTGWFDAWRTLGYILVPPLVLLTGAAPINTPPLVFVLAFGSTFCLQRLALGLLSRGYAPQGMAMLFELVRMQSNAQATLAYLRRNERSFRVTAKTGAGKRRRIQAPWLLWSLGALTVVAIAWFAFTLVGLTPTSYPIAWVAYGAVGWGAFNAVLLVSAIARITSRAFSADRRSGVRLDVAHTVFLDGRASEVLDISMGGLLVRTYRPLQPSDRLHVLRFAVGGDDITMVAREHHVHAAPSGVLVGLEFLSGQDEQVARLAVRLFTGRQPRAVVPKSAA